ncbi:MAG: hypothetical protein ABMA02_05240 [Saprospiraceae bacterium]
MKSIFLIPVFFFASVGLFATAANHNDNGTEPTFQEFLAQFPKANLPYSFNAEELQTQLEQHDASLKGKRLDWAYYQFLPMIEESARHNRMPVYPEAVAAFETNEYYAVLYNTGRTFTKNLKSYHISVFDKSGNHLATHFVAGANPNTITTSVIDETLHAAVQVYRVTWATEYQRGANDGNSIVSLAPAGKQTVLLTVGNMVEQLSWASQQPVAKGGPQTADAK